MRKNGWQPIAGANSNAVDVPKKKEEKKEENIHEALNSTSDF